MTREEAIANLEMISIAFVDPVTKEQRKLIDDTFEMAIKALEQMPCKDATNGEVLMKMFPPSVYYGYGYNEKHFAILAKDCEFICSNDEWWNAKYKAESENKK